MSEQWEKMELGKVCEIILGQSPSSDTYNQDRIGLPFFQGKSEFGSKYARAKIWCSDPVKTAKMNDILLSVRAPVGESNLAPNICCIGRGLAALRADQEKLLQEFLWHQIDFKKVYLQRISQGSTFDAISGKDLSELEIEIPPLPEQKKIAEILSGIDKAISIKRIRHERRLIAANLIFESLLSNIESRQAALSQIAHLERGKFSHRPRNDPAYYGGLYPFIQTGDIPKTGVAIREHKQTLNEKGLKVSRQFPAGTLVITIAATIGEVGILSYPACFPDSLVGIDPHKDKCDPVYLLFLLRRLKNTLLQMAPQSAQSNLNLEILGKLSVPLPSLPDQHRFSRMITCEDKRASAEDIEIMKLQYLKTAVANDLLSGRKRVTV